jgi:probable O-glycosylation ligase (exosortase A-associated)
MPLRATVLIAFFVASLPVCFFRPTYGIILWTIVAFLNPQAYTWTGWDAFPWAVAVAVPTIFGMLVFDRKFERLMVREVWLLGLLWAWFTVTTLVSMQQPELAHHAFETWEKWKFVSKILLMTVCMIPIVSSFERLRYVVLTIAGCFGIYVLKSLPFVISTGGAHRIYGPERSMIADNTDFGLALNMTLPLYFFLAQTESKPWVKRFFAFLFVITIPAIFFTYSRGALLALAAVLALMLLQVRRRFLLLPVIVLGTVIALYFAPAAWQERMNPTGENVVDASARGRLHAWAYARALAAEYPITGGGFATFTEELYQRYWPGEIYTIYGPHSIYFQVLAEHGFVGLAFYLSLVLSCIASTWRLRRQGRTRGDPEVSNYAQMLQLSLIGFLISGIFLGRAYFDYFFTVVACIVILQRAARDRCAVKATAAQADPSAYPHRTVLGPHQLPVGQHYARTRGLGNRV